MDQGLRNLDLVPMRSTDADKTSSSNSSSSRRRRRKRRRKRRRGMPEQQAYMLCSRLMARLAQHLWPKNNDTSSLSVPATSGCVKTFKKGGKAAAARYSTARRFPG
ncbi:unnamed protein product [Pleuronectes platessa]|uniref:Uncharacterized protein n=1 Tax=Pleuronectes platessa TaxID=8262 RepID=A0A9N7VL72_PLEPL|nr:unnamed protein product [Pleuronectes platessa]